MRLGLEGCRFEFYSYWFTLSELNRSKTSKYRCSQKLLGSPCSETTEPISINDTPLDAPWSEWVQFWILLKLVHMKWTKLVQNHQKSMQPSPCSETTEPISIKDTPLDAPWSESVPFWILLKLVHIKWTKLVQNQQKSMQPSPCSETTEPISINDTPLDAPWSESVPFWILLKLVHIKWTKLVQNHQKSMQPSPCSETTEPISIHDTLLDAPWSGSVPFWILLKLVHIKWTKLVQNQQKSMQPSPCSETTEPISINDTPLDAPWSESVPFWILLKLVHIKWTKLVQNQQKSMQPSPCSETTEPISINDTPVDAPWSESVPFWILLKLVYIKWTKLVQNHQKSMQPSPCSETTEPTTEPLNH